MKKKSLRSSECVWSNDLVNASKLIRSLDPIHKVTLISPAEQPKLTSPDASEVVTSLKEILDKAPAIAIVLPRNASHDFILLRDGKLWLYLTAESFYTYGLDGKKFGDRYLCIYNLREEGKRRDRLIWAANNTITETFTFLVQNTDTGRKASWNSSRILDVVVPPLSPEDDDEFDDWSNAFVEWIGLVLIAPQLLVENSDGVDNAICDYMPPLRSKRTSTVVSHETGLLRPDQIAELWDAVSSHPWAVLHVQGFSFSPTTWNPDKPHNAGEVGYTLIRNGDTSSCLRYVS